jgi:hypothetical protein
MLVTSDLVEKVLYHRRTVESYRNLPEWMIQGLNPNTF